ncbi:MAG: TonB-dependent receptor [Gammaproteobacteria bacterium]|nr:TonB-dependent receptor [Gammaproteobacteria bacterium]
MAKLTPFTQAFAAAVLGLLWSAAAAAAADDLATLKAELEALKTDYNSRVQALEQRIKALEDVARAAPTAPAAPPVAAAPAAAAGAAAFAEAAPTALPTPAGKSGNATAFNPAISMIITGNYNNLSVDPATYRIAGFMPPPEGEGPGDRSFNLGESELTVAANVDPYFFANVTAAIQGDNSIDIEEAYFKTLALNHGFTLKGGRFFSGTGYLNEVHSHNWDFVDQPLVYQAFFAGQLAQDGLQLRWLAPTDYFIELGAEAGSGRSFPGTQRDSNALGSTALFAHTGGDIGDSTSWRVGVSWLQAHSSERAYQDTDESGTPVTDAFSGTTRTWIVDATLKWAPHGDPTHHQLKVQGEYMRRTEDGQLAFDVSGLNLVGPYSSGSQSGWYLQAVYGFIQRWRAGLRYDSMNSGTPSIGLVSAGMLPAAAFPALLPGTPRRTTVMVDWSLSEFSRLRAQYAWDEARAAHELDHQLFLQYIFAIGAHGAHKF